MNWETVAERDGWLAQVMPDDDAQLPDEDDDVEQGFYLTATSNRYFERNHAQLEDESERKACWSFPLFMYAHSGVLLSLGAFACPWDSGQVCGGPGSRSRRDCRSA